MLNQQSHLRLRLDPKPDPLDVVVRVPLPRARVRATIRYALKFYSSVGHSLPYNFRFPNDVFDAKRSTLLLRRGEGLTCSTLVIALLAATATELLQMDQWPVRPEDSERNAKLVDEIQEAMKRRGPLTPDDIEHLAYMRTQVAAVRFRPEEVAAAAGQRLPASFVDAVTGAAALLDEYDLVLKSSASKPAPGGVGVGRHT